MRTILVGATRPPKLKLLVRSGGVMNRPYVGSSASSWHIMPIDFLREPRFRHLKMIVHENTTADDS